ncbi:hypothetical protein SAMN02745857_00441 [Andreprevotia lacus DSM 23236]|jgi:hypothetical protein|uniref:Uncharacterized protein n=1 Tax=Andreprevotia lacus DSM 23236 TaxID=1121001 RepID=A0A1W1X3J2_9NEIS|nr:hypothetical protein [Andreprevotia lacus]SMC17981.1 hypothetical protein SAMN02745857_00441 [Andreprevotia lacus DSM 23236]
MHTTTLPEINASTLTYNKIEVHVPTHRDDGVEFRFNDLMATFSEPVLLNSPDQSRHAILPPFTSLEALYLWQMMEGDSCSHAMPSAVATNLKRDFWLEEIKPFHNGIVLACNDGHIFEDLFPAWPDEYEAKGRFARLVDQWPLLAWSTLVWRWALAVGESQIEVGQ